MGILSKLMFWKRRDKEEMEEGGGGLPPREMPEEEFPTRGPGEELPNTEVPPWSRQPEEQPRLQPAGFEQPQPQQQQAGNINEVIMARLDVINSKIDALNQRLINMERYLAEEEKRTAKW
ncbi:MAG: hypothetical protein CMH63_01660 [Nanoarchaeota archaeon]|jgi:hypothetical protein|nr:hypothetical protein [Nanoarchaeota archaeon]|tara:strand:- start:12113 stop:12472 length:360 start_codon:yes stop_codon:yes gene_type:complete